MTLPPPLSAHDLATAEAQAIHAETDGYYGQFEITKLRASPDNRKRFNEQALQELAASIKTMGVAQAILIRPVTSTAEAPEEFEIVAGERRFRASKIAGKTHIPALCRPLSDLDAAKIRILENLQREDPHPMEEAEGYQLLMLQHGFTADQLVDEVKKSRAYIYGRLKLCALTNEVRELFLDDTLSASTALLVARIPVPALQIKAAQEILAPDWQGNTMSHRSAANHIQNRYMLKLGAAVFSLTDAKLLASAGSCVKCPKRAGNQPEVFEGIDANVCTDPDCFAEKKAAHAAALQVQANKKGIPMLEGEEASLTLSRRHNHTSEFVTADMSLFYFSRNAPRTKNNGYVHDYLLDGDLPPVASYAKLKDGNLVPMYKRADIQAALELVGACETVEEHQARMRALAENPGPVTPSTATQLRQAKKEQEIKAQREADEKENAFRLALYKQLRQRASVAGLSLPSLREHVSAVLDEHGLDSSVHDLYDFDVRTDLAEFIDHADANALQLLLLDLMLGTRLDSTFWHGDSDDEFAPIMAMARHEGIDVDAVRAEIFAPAPEQQPAEPEPVAEPGTESAPAVIETSDTANSSLATAPADETGQDANQADTGAASITVRYRNPTDPSQTWTGRGRQPKWVSEWVGNGKPLDALRVDAATSADQVDGEQPAEEAQAEASQAVQTSALTKKTKAKSPAKKAPAGKKQAVEAAA